MSKFSPAIRAILCAATATALAGCNNSQPQPAAQQSAPPPAARYSSVPAGVTPSSFRMPEGSGCKGAVARWAAIQDNDLRSGHVTASVYKTIQGEIAQARAACDAGKDAQAQSIVRASRLRHGYPAG
ncbi:MAG: hypothetical protein AB7F96_05645 [Beijerinckiaceae bacterium]